MDFSKTKDEETVYNEYLENQIKGTHVDDAVEALELLVEALISQAEFFSDLKTRILQKNLDFEKVGQSVEAGTKCESHSFLSFLSMMFMTCIILLSFFVKKASK